MDNLIERHVKSIDYAIKNFPVVALVGARQVGKTTLFDLERQIDFDLIETDPEFLSPEESSVGG